MSLRKLSLVVVMAALLLMVGQAFAQSGSTSEIELVGTITDQRDGMIVVNDLTVLTTGAEIKTALEIGAAVKVEGTLLEDGAIQAREIGPASLDILPQELELVGTLDSIGAAEAVVNGLTFDISAAEVEAGLLPGDLVKVHASQRSDGTWAARELERHTPEDDGAPEDSDSFEITGTLDEVGDGFIVVSGQTIDTTAVEIKGSLAVGVLVKVEGRVVGGAWIASEVKLTSPDDSAFDDSGSGACGFKVDESSVSLRSGPGTGYDVIGYGYEHQLYPVTGVHPDGGWLQVQTPAGAAWVAGSVGERYGACDMVPALDTPFVGGDDGSSSGDDSGSHDSMDNSGDDHGTDDSMDDSGDDHGADDDHDSGDDHGADDSMDDSGDDSKSGI